jgi:hypothetical protein
MPYTVKLGESGGFAVLYFLPEHPGSIEVFWAGKKLDAEMEATRLNEIDRLLSAKLGRILTELTGELNAPPEKILDLIERWVTAKRGGIWGENQAIDL